MNRLRPGYKPPSRKDLSGVLLDKVHEEVNDKMTEELKDVNSMRPVTLIQDGWSSIHNDPIIATSIHTGAEPYLMSAVDCEAEKKTSDYCLKLALEDIEKCRQLYSKEVFAFCTYR